MAYNNTVDVRWEPLVFRQYTITDSLFPGTQFGQEQPDPRFDHFEVERQFNEEEEPDDAEWYSLGTFSSPTCSIQTLFERAVKVRIRAVLRDGSRTDWAYSGWFSLFGMTADFADFNNALFLGIV
jgi:hypothetical protein